VAPQRRTAATSAASSTSSLIAAGAARNSGAAGHCSGSGIHDVQQQMMTPPAGGPVVDADELAHFCLHALGAAADLRSRAEVHRLVAVTLNGLSASRSTPPT
jgi:hypothetical protein